MTISEYKKFFASINSYPKKSLGQNYLIDKNILYKIGEIAELSPDDRVIEVGTGFGFLTSFLAEHAERVISIEKDKAVFNHISDKFASYKNVELINEDALSINFKDIVGDKKYKVISNLPYSVASQIIFGLLECYESFECLVIMVQKEMGERICSKPNNKQYGAFTVIVQSYFDTEIKHTVSPNSFWPKPEVDSVIIKMTPRKEKAVSDTLRPFFNELVKKSFQTRRKKLINNLKPISNKESLIEIFTELDFNEKARAEQLSLNDYVNLSRAIKSKLD
ncbi:MAG: ribosomal RNA small subunit methyltransferase A [Candidatus Dadabacteria bacterium]|nr:ribosomal RNA small subunit methyltransferase A [Candidatus Dadabacteria bacterium]